MDALRILLVLTVIACGHVKTSQGRGTEDEKTSKSIGISKRDEDLRSYESRHKDALKKEAESTKLTEGTESKRNHFYASDLSDDYNRRLRERQRLREEIEDAVERELEQNEAMDLSFQPRQLGPKDLDQDESSRKREKNEEKEHVRESNKKRAKATRVNIQKKKTVKEVAAKETQSQKKKQTREKLNGKKGSEEKRNNGNLKNREVTRKKKRFEGRKESKKESSAVEKIKKRKFQMQEEKKEEREEDDIEIPLKRMKEEERRNFKGRKTKRNGKHNAKYQRDALGKQRDDKGQSNADKKRNEFDAIDDSKGKIDDMLIEEKEEKYSRFPWKDIRGKASDEKKSLKKQSFARERMGKAKRTKNDKQALQQKPKRGSSNGNKPPSKYSRFVKKNIPRSNEDMYRLHDRP